MNAALAKAVTKLPEQLRKTLTWDRGKELSAHAQFAMQSGTRVFLADPHSPWQRPTNENTNGLLRQYFPKGTDLSRWSAEDLEAIAHTTIGPARSSAGRPPPKSSRSNYARFNNLVLHRPVELTQFRSRKFVRALDRHRMAGSIGTAGAAGDNAAMESFFSLLQKNVLDRRTWTTREELRIAIVTWIERTYHRRRRQAALGRLTPIEFETVMATPALKAA
jgi:transposase InsO family protein